MVKIQNSQKTNLLYKKPFQVLRLLVHKQEHFIWRTGSCCRESPYPNSQLHGISFQLRTAGSIRACISQCLVMAARGLPELHTAISAWTSSPRAGSHLFKIVGPTLLRPTLLSQAAPACSADRKTETLRIYKPKHYHSLPTEQTVNKHQQVLIMVDLLPNKTHVF